MKRLFKILMIITLLTLFVGGIFAQDRGLSLQVVSGLDSPVGKQWAVFIAIDRYQEWGPLNNPVRDAREIRDILLEFYHIDEVRKLYDHSATAEGIRQLFVNLRSQVGINDSVFVFYAGHGYTDPHTNTGSWIPTDGGRNTMAQANWLPNIQVRNLLAQLPAKHVFLIADSCFSGDILDITRGAPPRIDINYYRQAYSRVSRKVMTSGASEAVPDASEFAMRLKSSLRRAEGPFIDPEYLYIRVREVQSTQPMLGVIRVSEHQDGGSFLFFRKQTAANVPVQPPASAAAQAHYERGIIFFDREDDDTAILEFNDAISLNPNFADAYAYRARAYNSKQDYDQGLADANQAIRLDPNSSLGYYARGIAYYEKNDFDRAIADYTQAIRINPNFVFAYNNRGVAYQQKGDFARARADYEAALRIDPNHTTARNNLNNLGNR